LGQLFVEKERYESEQYHCQPTRHGSNPMSDQELSQDGIDRSVSNIEARSSRGSAIKVLPYDFRRPDRVAKDLLRTIHSIHDNFARALGSSLSAYLRSFVATNVVSVDQISFSELVKGVSAPTYMVTLRMSPNEGVALLELNNSLVFPMIEVLLGGTGKGSKSIERETTEIERRVLDGILRLILRDLRSAWLTMAEIEFTVDGYQSASDLFQFLPPNEAMLAISMEIRIGEHSGLLNLSIPSIVIKMLQQRATSGSGRRAQTTEAEQKRMLDRIKSAKINADVRLTGTHMLLEDLMTLEVGNVIALHHLPSKPIDLYLNSCKKFSGYVTSAGNKRTFQIQKRLEDLPRDSKRLSSPSTAADDKGVQQQLLDAPGENGKAE
jgi:flagellar motor switch protein FliM